MIVWVKVMEIKIDLSEFLWVLYRERFSWLLKFLYLIKFGWFNVLGIVFCEEVVVIVGY